MSSTASFISTGVARLSARAHAVPAVAVASAAPAPAAASVFGNPAGDSITKGHMTTGWLGDLDAAGYVPTTSVTKRITTGSLFEVST